MILVVKQKDSQFLNTRFAISSNSVESFSCQTPSGHSNLASHGNYAHNRSVFTGANLEEPAETALLYRIPMGHIWT